MACRNDTSREIKSAFSYGVFVQVELTVTPFFDEVRWASWRDETKRRQKIGAAIIGAAIAVTRQCFVCRVNRSNKLRFSFPRRDLPMPSWVISRGAELRIGSPGEQGVNRERTRDRDGWEARA